MLHRSWLYIPASNTRALEKGTVLFPDVFIFDLEDAVAQEDKAGARITLADFLPHYHRRNIWLRVNHPSSPFFTDDIAFATAHGIKQLVLPKTECVEDIAALNLPDLHIITSIETPKGVLEAKEIAAHPQVYGLVAGLNDLAFALRRFDDALASILDTIQLTATAYGKLALDGVYNHYQDAEGFACHAQRGKTLGFHGKTLIHPSQIELTHRIYHPTEAEYLTAKELLANVECNKGAVGLNGQMVEAMHVANATYIVEVFEYNSSPPSS